MPFNVKSLFKKGKIISFFQVLETYPLTYLIIIEYRSLKIRLNDFMVSPECFRSLQDNCEPCDDS